MGLVFRGLGLRTRDVMEAKLALVALDQSVMHADAAERRCF